MYWNASMKSNILGCAEDCQSLLPVCICHAELWTNAFDILQTTLLDVQAFGKQTTPEVLIPDKCWDLSVCVMAFKRGQQRCQLGEKKKKKQKSGCAPVQSSPPPAYFSLLLGWVPAFNCSWYPILKKERTYVHNPPAPRLTHVLTPKSFTHIARMRHTTC